MQGIKSNNMSNNKNNNQLSTHFKKMEMIKKLSDEDYKTLEKMWDRHEQELKQLIRKNETEESRFILEKTKNP